MDAALAAYAALAALFGFEARADSLLMAGYAPDADHSFLPVDFDLRRAVWHRRLVQTCVRPDASGSGAAASIRARRAAG